MALVGAWSFDHENTNHPTSTFFDSDNEFDEGGLATSAFGNGAIPRNGNTAARISEATTWLGYGAGMLPVISDQVVNIFHFYLYLTAFPSDNDTQFFMANTNDKASAQRNWGIRLTSNTAYIQDPTLLVESTNAFELNTPYWVACYWDNSAVAIDKMYVRNLSTDVGSYWIDTTGIGLPLLQAAENLNKLYISYNGLPTPTVSYFIDNVIWLTNQGTVNNVLLEAEHVCLNTWPSGDGRYTEMTASVGGGGSYAMWNDNPCAEIGFFDRRSNNVAISAGDKRQLSTTPASGALGITGAPIGFVGRLLNDLIWSANTLFLISDGTTDRAQVSFAAWNDINRNLYKLNPFPFDTNAAGLAWTKANVDTLQIGVQALNDAVNSNRFSNLWGTWIVPKANFSPPPLSHVTAINQAKNRGASF